METFKDKMDDKSYQIIFETLAASQFISRLQLKLLTSDQVDCLQCSYVNRKFKNTKLKPVTHENTHSKLLPDTFFVRSSGNICSVVNFYKPFLGLQINGN